jgi:hypothetical protein
MLISVSKLRFALERQAKYRRGGEAPTCTFEVLAAQTFHLWGSWDK